MKNYTSSVPVERTISRIEMALARAGASNILKEYSQCRVMALCFQVKIPPEDKMVSVRLPIDAQAVLEVLRKGVKKPRAGTLERIEQQADRTAWKLMQDWTEVQLSLIEMRQADLLQVFLPYVWDGNMTFYNRLKGKGFRALLGDGTT